MTQEETGEKEALQRRVMALLRVVALVMLILAGLDHRFRWSAVPLWLAVVACFAFLAGAAVIVIVFRENTFGSSIVEVAEGQLVVTNGGVPTVALLLTRLLHEERFLSERLEGYAAYLKSTRARLVPWVF
jgi:protein-S-isoprenylcysteine O-methyltransferase Ste14